MAIRRQKLRHRVAAVGGNQARAENQHPQLAGSGGVPMVMPLAAVLVAAPPGGQYATIGYESLTPIWGPMGEPVPASSPGHWGQLVAAGR